MRILHLISQRPDSTGSGIYIQEMLRGSAESGHENRLIAGIQAGSYPQLDTIDSSHCNFIEFSKDDFRLPIIGMSDVMPYRSGRFRDLTMPEIARYEHEFSCMLTQVIHRLQPDLIHSHHLWLLSSLTSRLFPEIPLVTTCHGSDLRQFRNCPHLQKRVLSGCMSIPAVLALSEPQKSEIVQLYNIPEPRVHVAGGGFNNRIFHQIPKPAPEPARILYAGKLSNAKGVPWLLEALSHLKQTSFHLDLVGGGAGEEYQHCLKLASHLGASVTVHGSVEQQRLAELMRASHIMVLPSLFEGLPLIMLEAISSGCRVIATDLPGTREISNTLDTQYITLLPKPRCRNVDEILQEDESQFTKSLVLAIECSLVQAENEPDLDLQPIADRVEQYSWAKVYERTEHVYNLLLAHH